MQLVECGAVVVGTSGWALSVCPRRVSLATRLCGVNVAACHPSCNGHGRAALSQKRHTGKTSKQQLGHVAGCRDRRRPAALWTVPRDSSNPRWSASVSADDASAPGGHAHPALRSPPELHSQAQPLGWARASARGAPLMAAARRSPRPGAPLDARPAGRRAALRSPDWASRLDRRTFLPYFLGDWAGAPRPALFPAVRHGTFRFFEWRGRGRHTDETSS